MPIILVHSACAATADNISNPPAPNSHEFSAKIIPLGPERERGPASVVDGVRGAYALVMMEGTAEADGGGSDREGQGQCSYAQLIHSLQERGAKGVVVSAPAGVEVEELTCRCVFMTSRAKSWHSGLGSRYGVILIRALHSTPILTPARTV